MAETPGEQKVTQPVLETSTLYAPALVISNTMPARRASEIGCPVKIPLSIREQRADLVRVLAISTKAGAVGTAREQKS